jgi:hypothetical protein
MTPTERLRALLQEHGCFDPVIYPALGYWRKADGHRWDGRAQGFVDGRMVDLTLGSWCQIKDCARYGIHVFAEGWYRQVYCKRCSDGVQRSDYEVMTGSR